MNGMNKKSQVTLFIVVGILLLFLIAFVLFLSSEYIKNAGQGKDTLDHSISVNNYADLENYADLGSPVQLYVEQCLRTTAENAIMKNSRYGGYFITPSRTSKTPTDFDNDFANVAPRVPVYTQLDFISDEKIAEEINMYVISLVDICFNDFKSFKEQGYEVSLTKDSSAVTLFANATLIINAEIPLIIKKGEKIQKLSSFEVKVPVDQFYEDLNTAKRIAGSYSEKGVCVSCFSDLSEKYDLEVRMEKIDDGTYIIDILDKNFFVDKEEYHFIFGVKTFGVKTDKQGTIE